MTRPLCARTNPRECHLELEVHRPAVLLEQAVDSLLLIVPQSPSQLCESCQHIPFRRAVSVMVLRGDIEQETEKSHGKSEFRSSRCSAVARKHQQHIDGFKHQPLTRMFRTLGQCVLNSNAIDQPRMSQTCRASQEALSALERHRSYPFISGTREMGPFPI